jgi:hypothetical protein
LESVPFEQLHESAFVEIAGVFLVAHDISANSLAKTEEEERIRRCQDEPAVFLQVPSYTF